MRKAVLVTAALVCTLLFSGCANRLIPMSEAEIAEKYYPLPIEVVEDTMEELYYNRVRYRIPITIINGQYSVRESLEKFAATRFLTEEKRAELEAREGIRYLCGETDSSIYYRCSKTNSSLGILVMPNDMNLSLDPSNLDTFVELVSQLPYSERTIIPTESEILSMDHDSVTLKVVASGVCHYARIFVTVDDVVVAVYVGDESDPYYAKLHETIDTLVIVPRIEIGNTSVENK